jgi:hypothetical protein
VKERGKTYHFTMPEKDGWYETNALGLPFGKPSSSSNPKARYLWRVNEYEGLVSRYDCWPDGYVRRYVGYGVSRRGVLAKKGGKAPKHKHNFVCTECGKKKR